MESFTQVSLQNETKLKRPVMNKRSSLLCQSIKDDENKVFLYWSKGANVIKLFFLSSLTKKLASLSSQLGPRGRSCLSRMWSYSQILHYAEKAGIIFGDKARNLPYRGGAQRCPLGKALVLPKNIRLGRKGLSGTNTQAHFASLSVEKGKKSFTILTRRRKKHL